MIRAYTDGACEGNPGPGGFGVVYYTADEPGSKPVELYGAHSDTTNNQMELMAAIALLEALPDGAQVELHTDSRYVQDGITQWLPGWKARNWRLKSGGAVKNVGLWRRLDKAANRHRVRWLWVKGHAGHDDNERADELARLAIRHWRSGRLPETDLAEDATTPAGAPLNNGAAPSAPSAPSGKPAGRRGLFDEPTQAGQPRPNAARRLVLASTSPYRRQQLARLGLAFEAHAPGVDEAAVKASGLAPVELVRTLARQKAEALAPRVPDGLLIGGDQTVMLDGQALDKPGSAARAVEHLLRLAGRTHHLLTAVAVHDAASGTTREHLDVHEMTMRPLTREQARRYVERDRTWDCAGAYKIEATGIALFRRIYGEDATAIEGLPLLWLCATLAEAGFDPLASG